MSSSVNSTTSAPNITVYLPVPDVSPEVIIIPVIFGLVCILGLVGNSLVIIVVLKERKMKTTTNLFILNLSLADFFFLLICVPVTAVSYASPSWPFRQFICKIVNYLLFVNMYASVYTLLMMSFDRYLAVVYPIRSMKFRNVRNASTVVITMWCVILLALSPVAVKFQTYSFVDEYGRSITYCGASFTPFEFNLFWLQLFFTSYLVPLIIISITYFFMLKRLWTGVAPQGSHTKESVKQKKRVTKMVVFVVIIFCVTWMPIQIMSVLLTLELIPYSETTTICLWIGNILSYINSCVNPIIYAFLSDNFRKSFKKVCICYRESAQIDFDRTDGRVSENSPGTQTVSA
ncbi:allatostatin-A receptor-like [Saccoglossus kowalevskii]|uniref:Allatostatin-A receptor-like n=1 Tax=Saccoglossus kowalevskii TaxID=10224 RepID=A0ABM0GJ23_SACKO|nr:PREDICTED: allatostatin-A receptor-like [Saccoglossus kowalevskii]